MFNVKSVTLTLNQQYRFVIIVELDGPVPLTATSYEGRSYEEALVEVQKLSALVNVPYNDLFADPSEEVG